MITAQSIVERSLAAFRDQVAVVDANRTVTFSVLANRSARLANACRALGAGQLRPVATYLENDAHFVEVDVACMRGGMTRVGITTRLTADECNYILAHSGSSVLVTRTALFERLDLSALSGLHVVLIDGGHAEGPVFNYEALLERASSNTAFEPVGVDDPAYIFYTSGTSGRPKGATHSHGGRAAAMVNMLSSELVINDGDAMLHTAPVTHGGGSKILSFLASGQRNIIVPRFDPEAFGRKIIEDRATHSFMVPTMLQMLLEAGPTVIEQVRSLRQISFGGAPISDALFERAFEQFGPILTQVYGSCEAPHPITVLRPEDYCHSSAPGRFAQTAGRASHMSELRIVGADGRDCPTGGEGELLLRAPHLMSGYWHNAEATSEAISADRWYATGDIAFIDESGFIHFQDRKRDLIISGGFNVYPSEVERVLSDHPNVREVAVIGFPDDRWGESIMACIVLHAPNPAFAAEVGAWLESRIAGYKRPRRYEILDELPKGSTNKILKRELRDRFWQNRGRRIN